MLVPKIIDLALKHLKIWRPNSAFFNNSYHKNLSRHFLNIFFHLNMLKTSYPLFHAIFLLMLRHLLIQELTATRSSQKTVSVASLDSLSKLTLNLNQHRLRISPQKCSLFRVGSFELDLMMGSDWLLCLRRKYNLHFGPNHLVTHNELGGKSSEIITSINHVFSCFFTFQTRLKTM